MTVITASCHRRHDGSRIYVLELTGHANYGPPGQDIVCAGISTMVTALAEWLVEHDERAHLTQLKLDPGDNRIVCSGDVDDVVQMAVMGFALLEQQYPDNILLDLQNFPGLPDANTTDGVKQ